MQLDWYLSFLHVWNAEILALANIVLAIFTIVLAIGIPLTIFYSARQERDVFYATLDRAYFDIQKTLIEYPHLAVSSSVGKTLEQNVQYDAFAFITWNFLESIFDYAEHNKVLRETWHCILCYEAALHGAWFLEPRNARKFKDRFTAYVADNNLIPESIHYPSVSPDALVPGGPIVPVLSQASDQ